MALFKRLIKLLGYTDITAPLFKNAEKLLIFLI